jgi:hypothetical protein
VKNDPHAEKVKPKAATVKSKVVVRSEEWHWRISDMARQEIE